MASRKSSSTIKLFAFYKKSTKRVEEMEQICPNCGAAIPVTEGYPVWCDKCDWGLLLPTDEKKRKDFLGKFYDKLSANQAKGLLERTLRGESETKGLTTTVLAYALAALVYLIMLAFVAAAVFLIIAIIRQPGLICMGAIFVPLFLLLAWLVRPQFGKFPKKYLLRNEAPTLYGLADRVADAMGAKHISAIVLDERFNARYAEIGLRKKPVMILGLPMLIGQKPQEVVATIAHELAHGVNGDPGRSLFLGSALNALETWRYLITPSTGPGLSLVAFLIATFMTLVSGIPGLMAMALGYLTFRARQLAEYRADALGAKVSGTAAAVGNLRRLELAPSYRTIAQRNWARRNMSKASVWDELREYVAHLPQRELDRFARVQQKTESRLDDTHPPTDFRVQALVARQTPQPSVVLSDADYAMLMQELKKFEAPIEAEMMGE